MPKTIEREEVRYCDMYLLDDQGAGATGRVSLFVRRFRLWHTPTGQPRVDVTGDVWGLENVDAMVDMIERTGMKGLPAAADDDREYLPVGFRRKDVKVRAAPGRIRLPVLADA